MISVLVLGFETATKRTPTLGESVRTLSALVPGTVDGLIRDVVLLATSPGTDLAKVADHAGCAFVVAPQAAVALASGIAQTRSEHVLVLLAGVSFDRALSDEIAVSASRAAAGRSCATRVHAAGGGWLARLAPVFASTVGVLTTRQRLGQTSAVDFATLVRALRPRRAFKSRAWSGAE